MSRDTDHQSCEQQWRDDGFNQPQKDKSEHAQIGGNVGEVVPDLGPQQHGNENPCCKCAPKTAVYNQSNQRGPTEN
jgi:hypothetical protein